MKLGMHVGLGLGHIVLHKDQAQPPPNGTAPFTKFSAHMCSGQMAEWIKMPLGMEVGLGPGDFVLDGDPAAAPQNGAEAPSPIFGLCPLWPNGWMDQECTWHGGGPRSRPHCAR